MLFSTSTDLHHHQRHLQNDYNGRFYSHSVPLTNPDETISSQNTIYSSAHMTSCKFESGVSESHSSQCKENWFGNGDNKPYTRVGDITDEDLYLQRKAATKESTEMLKDWLQKNSSNPYPSKHEKVMLAIVTKMSLTQVSTWFANARRRLKKENKMTWSPKNKSGNIFSKASRKRLKKEGISCLETSKSPKKVIDSINSIGLNVNWSNDMTSKNKCEELDSIQYHSFPDGDCKRAKHFSDMFETCQAGTQKVYRACYPIQADLTNRSGLDQLKMQHYVDEQGCTSKWSKNDHPVISRLHHQTFVSDCTTENFYNYLQTTDLSDNFYKETTMNLNVFPSLKTEPHQTQKYKPNRNCLTESIFVSCEDEYNQATFNGTEQSNVSQQNSSYEFSFRNQPKAQNEIFSCNSSRGNCYMISDNCDNAAYKNNLLNNCFEEELMNYNTCIKDNIFDFSL